MVPKELRTFLKKLVDEQVSSIVENFELKYKELKEKSEKQEQKIEDLQTEIKILKEGGNI